MPLLYLQVCGCLWVVCELSVGCLWGYLCGCVLHVLIHVYMYVSVYNKSVLPCYYLLNTYNHIENNQPTDSGM